MLGFFYKIIYETLLTRNIILENELNFKVECNFFVEQCFYKIFYIKTNKKNYFKKINTK
jgi:hypothetical protein